MDQPKPQRGNFVAFLNPDKEPDNKLPAFVNGRISKPGADEEFGFSLWPFSYTNKTTGEVLTGYNGRMSVVPIGADPRDQIQVAVHGKTPEQQQVVEGPRNLQLLPGAIILYVSKPKEGSITEKPKDFYGYANFGDGSPYVDVSVWVEKDRYGRAYIRGSTEFPRVKDETAPVIEALVDEDRVSREGAKAKRGRGGRGEE